MNPHVTLTQKNVWITIGVLTLFMLAALNVNTLNAQTEASGATTATLELAQEGRIIKGLVSDENGPLEDVNIVLKKSKIGTTSNSKGEFTFPQPLNTGDVLVFSFLGFETQEIKIQDSTTFMNVNLSDDVIEFIGALDSNTPYKSKRGK